MIFINSITNALFTAITSDQTVVNSGFKAQKYEIYNTLPNLSPWVGVYRPEIDIEPARAQVNRPWIARLDIPIFVQVAGNVETLEQVQDELERVTSIVMTAVDCNRPLKDTVESIIGYTVTPLGQSGVDDPNQDYFYANEIHIFAEVFA